uniref:Uncharacterized protein n=1 Tax=Triticum urartu TaxID=4572 RepID=A0A8R7UBN4_TRIUA
MVDAGVGDDLFEEAPGLANLVAVVVVVRQLIEDGEAEDVELVEIGVKQRRDGPDGAWNAGDAERDELPPGEHGHDDGRRAPDIALRGVLPAEHLDEALDGGRGDADPAERGFGEAVGLGERDEDAGAKALLVVRARSDEVVGVGDEAHVEAIQDAAVEAARVGVVEEAAYGDLAVGTGEIAVVGDALEEAAVAHLPLP